MAVYSVGYSFAGLPLDFMTLGAFAAAAVQNDEGQFYYANATQRRYSRESLFAVASTKSVSLTGMLPNRGCTFNPILPFANWGGDLSGCNQQVKLENLSLIGSVSATTSYGVNWNDQSPGLLGMGVRITNCFISGFANASVRFNAGRTGCCQIDKSCIAWSNGVGVLAIIPGSRILNCTIIGGGYGITCTVAAGAPVEITNCYVMGGQVLDIRTTGAVDPVVTYTATEDASADDWGGAGNLTAQHPYDMKFWALDSNLALGIYIQDYRILVSSPLWHKGTNLGLLTDCDGNPVDPATPSIGWHEGSATPLYLNLGGRHHSVGFHEERAA